MKNRILPIIRNKIAILGSDNEILELFSINTS